MSAAATPPRRLGYWEVASTVFYDTHRGASTAVVVAAVRGPLEIAPLRAALDLVQHRHPLLQATIARDGEGFHFVFDPRRRPVLSVQARDGDAAWEALVEAEFKRPFHIEQRLWRASLLASDTRHELVVSFHHSICDGMSAIRFFADLLSLYAELVAGREPDCAPLPLLPAVEQMLAEQPSWGAFLEAQRSVGPLPERRFQAYAPLGERQTRNLYTAWDDAATQALAKRARAERTTLHAALNAALALAAAGDAGGPADVALTTPINLRPYCRPKVGREHFGCYVSTVTTVHRGLDGGASLWAVARRYERELVERFLQQALLPREFDLPTVMGLFDTAAANQRQQFSLGFGVSNVGSVPLAERYGPLELTHVIGCTSREAGDWVMLLNTLTLHGRLVCAFSYTSPLVSAGWAAAFVADVEARLRHAAELPA